jgi:ATP-dependent DNA helicase RecQ
MKLTPQQILQQHWQHSSFRGEQEKIISAVIEEKDVLALLPTGGGKSICFQVPALLREGLCLVISPLIALMKDQVENLKKRNINAVAIDSGLSYHEVKDVFQKTIEGRYKFLYLSPERLASKLFQEYLFALNISLIAVDEAHCISQWGYDFRPSYLQIHKLREQLPKVSIIALTASATPAVQQDIINHLQLYQPKIFLQSFTKENISFSVFKVESKINKLIQILTNVEGSAIVYCKNRRLTKQVADLLHLQNIAADYYHAGLAQEQRNKKQQTWMNNELRVIVCTNAFGMGIDKPDVKVVIHYDMPECLENYYQEAGRAGRNGSRAFAVLLYQQQDINELKLLPNKRFPEVATIRKIYQYLSDYLQIPIGIGADNYYNFDLLTFCKNFKVDSFTAVAVLKILEQEGFLIVNESIFLPARVQFTANKFLLEDFEKSHPTLEPVMKCLLRTYEGIYDNSIAINEKQIAKLCGLSYDSVYADLLSLQSFGIINYLPQKETPQIHFLLNRASANDLLINTADYFERKKVFTERVHTMLTYIELQQTCRNKFIANYFGDATTVNCGSCDNCLSKKLKGLNEQEVKTIQEKILAAVDNSIMTVEQLTSRLSSSQQKKYFIVLQFLQEEKIIEISAFGSIKANLK